MLIIKPIKHKTPTITIVAITKVKLTILIRIAREAIRSPNIKPKTLRIISCRNKIPKVSIKTPIIIPISFSLTYK